MYWGEVLSTPPAWVSVTYWDKEYGAPHARISGDVLVYRVQGPFIHGHLNDELARSQKKISSSVPALPGCMSLLFLMQTIGNTQMLTLEIGWVWRLTASCKKGIWAYAVFHFLQGETGDQCHRFQGKLLRYTLALPFRAKASTSPSAPAPVLLVNPGQGSVAEPLSPCPPLQWITTSLSHCSQDFSHLPYLPDAYMIMQAVSEQIRISTYLWQMLIDPQEELGIPLLHWYVLEIFKGQETMWTELHGTSNKHFSFPSFSSLFIASAQDRQPCMRKQLCPPHLKVDSHS